VVDVVHCAWAVPDHPGTSVEMAFLLWVRTCGGGDGRSGVTLRRQGSILLWQRGGILVGRGSILLQWGSILLRWGIGCRGSSMRILIDDASKHVLHLPQRMDAMSSVLTMTVAGGGVLKVGGMAKTAGTRACVTVLTDDLAAVPARRKCTHSWKSCHSYGSSW
jgi:hypothetical protein